MKIKIIRKCSDFLKESNGNPLIKILPKQGPDQRKVKVRKRKSDSLFDTFFNSVFIEHPDLRQRCVFTSGTKALSSYNENQDMDIFYIFPINGYNFLYSPAVMDSYIQYNEILEKFINVMDQEHAIETFSEVLKYEYTSTNLAHGIELGCEIILYGIPYYYAIRKSSVISYSTLFSL